MSPTKSVLGVSGMCRVDSRYSTQIRAFYFAPLRVLCRVCWVSLCARAWAAVFDYMAVRFFSYARTNKPSTPDTPQAVCLKLLNLKAFICVGCVSTKRSFVSGWIVNGGAGR